MWLMQFLRDPWVPTNRAGIQHSKKEGKDVKEVQTSLRHCCLTSHSFGLLTQDFSARNFAGILAEGAIALSVTLSGGALFAS